MKCGLLGRKLGHSYSPMIHAQLGTYSYDLFEKEPEEVDSFLTSGDFDAINVTIPYKKTAIMFCDELSDIAKRVGAVNTLVRRADGKLVGHNTDYFGFQSMLHHSGLQPCGKKILIFGSGGVSAPVAAVLEEQGAKVFVISHKENKPEILLQHADASIIVNATPVGMYPSVGFSPVDLGLFPQLEGVLDLIFNPAKTKLLIDAEERGLVTENGLWMLVAQAKESSEWFTGTTISNVIIEPIYQKLCNQMQNIVLIGMPGSGKTTIGRILAEKLKKQFVDADMYLVECSGRNIADIFTADGESGFRTLETECLSKLGKQSGLVIATGGGCVTRSDNYPLLHQNGRIIWIKRALNRLAVDGRPLSLSTPASEMYRVREPMYRRFADLAVNNDSTPDDTAQKILNLLASGESK